MRNPLKVLAGALVTLLLALPYPAFAGDVRVCDGQRRYCDGKVVLDASGCRRCAEVQPGEQPTQAAKWLQWGVAEWEQELDWCKGCPDFFGEKRCSYYPEQNRELCKSAQAVESLCKSGKAGERVDRWCLNVELRSQTVAERAAHLWEKSRSSSLKSIYDEFAACKPLFLKIWKVRSDAAVQEAINRQLEELRKLAKESSTEEKVKAFKEAVEKLNAFAERHKEILSDPKRTFFITAMGGVQFDVYKQCEDGILNHGNDTSNCTDKNINGTVAIANANYDYVMQTDTMKCIQATQARH